MFILGCVLAFTLVGFGNWQMDSARNAMIVDLNQHSPMTQQISTTFYGPSGRQLSIAAHRQRLPESPLPGRYFRGIAFAAAGLITFMVSIFLHLR